MKVPERGKITCSIFSKKAPHGFDFIARVRALDFSIPLLAASVGARIPPDITVEQGEQIIEDLISATVWMRLTRQLRGAKYDLFGLLVQAANIPIEDGEPFKERTDGEGTGEDGDGPAAG